MNTEQKAKAYDKAIEKARKELQACGSNNCDAARQIFRFFPELKESEDDRIRKAIVKFFELQDDNTTYSFIPKKDILAWLEKQKTVGEIVERCKNSWYNEGKIAGKFEGLTDDEKYQQAWHDVIEAAKEEKVDNQNCVKSVDKAEPKFQEGDFIVDPYCRGKIIALTSDAYLLDTGQGIPFSCEDNVHLWTIEDAKAGDVLVLETDEVEWVLIYKEIVTASSEIPHDLLRYYSMLSGNYYYGKGVSALVTEDYEEYLKPATKEQCDLLFQKMKEAGYEWDAEKKELKKIEDEPENYKKQVMSEITDLVKDYIEQKSTWSEEDEKKLSDILAILRGGENCYYNSPILMDWLKSLKNRVIPQSKQEWSEEDEKISQWIISDIEKLFSLDKKSYIISNIEIDWLKSLKERIGG